MKVYCISGMGADHRVFRRLKVDGVHFVALPWVAYDDADTLQSYAAKMAAQISNEPEVVLLGLSFGGMLATEISRIRPVKKLVLISSAKTGNELPEPGGLVRRLIRSRLIPSVLFGASSGLSLWLKGVNSFSDKLDTHQRKVVSGRFMQWALKVIMDWPNTEHPANYAHIHGTMDVVIPMRSVAATHIIKGGGHLMVFRRPHEVSRILKEILMPLM